MASSSPFTSTPLHNFDLPKWKSDPKPNHRRRSMLIKKSKCDHIDDDVIKNKPAENKPLSKIVLKLPCNNKEKPVKVVNDDELGGNIIDDEAKTWNLRPRRPFVRKYANKIRDVNGVVSAATNTNASADNSKNHPPFGDNAGPTLHVSLTKDEIDEDMFAFTGAKASRRPKKRPRNIQKKLDYLFPGLRLLSITPDSYKVSESFTKG